MATSSRRFTAVRSGLLVRREITEHAGAHDSAVAEFQMLTVANALRCALGMDKRLLAELAAFKAGLQLGAPDARPVPEQQSAIIDADGAGYDVCRNSPSRFPRNAAGKHLVQFCLCFRAMLPISRRGRGSDPKGNRNRKKSTHYSPPPFGESERKPALRKGAIR